MYREDLALTNLQWLICHKTMCWLSWIHRYTHVLEFLGAKSFLLLYGLQYEGMPKCLACASIYPRLERVKSDT